MSPEREPLERTPAEVAEDEEFFRWYGPWAPLDPAGVAELMSGFDRPWWIIGGWSIEAFTGVLLQLNVRYKTRAAVKFTGITQ